MTASTPSRYRLEILNEGHDASRFQCEEEDFCIYLNEYALTDISLGLARTFVEIDQTQPATRNIAGFFTLRAHSALIEDSFFEDAISEDEDKSDAIYPSSIEVPFVELMFVARDLFWKGKGLGDTLMIDALKIVAETADRIGFIGLHLRSTPHGVRLYKRYQFSLFEEHPTFDGMRYILTVNDIRAIAASI